MPDVTTSQDYKIPLTTYTVQTAYNILNQYGVELGKADLEHQLMDNQSFYKRLLKVPALRVYNDHLLDYCHEVEMYCQETLVNISFTKFSLQSKNPDGGSPLSERREEQLANLQTQGQNLTDELRALEQQQKELQQQSDDIITDHFKEENKLQNIMVNHIMMKLTELGFEFTHNFRTKLLSRLKTNAMNVELTPETMTALNLEKQITGVEKAVISTLLEEVLDNG